MSAVNGALAGRDFMIGELPGADFMPGHASYLSRRLGCMPDELSNLHAYLKRPEARPAFQKGLQA